jgi:hypothetical protein
MKLAIAIFVFLQLLTGSTYSQNVYQLQDPVSSKNFNPEKYSGIRGTPFLADKWIKGSVSIARGVYPNLELKFNVYDNTLFFNKNDESFEFQEDVISFTLMPKEDPATHMIFKRGISGADLRGNEFVQVLLEAEMGLYKLDVKQLTEMSEINAGIVKTFANTAKYYIGKSGKLKFLKLNKQEVLAALSDKQDKIQAYINEKKYSFRKDTELVDVLKYYNSL